MKEGWEVKSLNEIFEVKSSRRVHKADWRKEGVPFYRAREVVKLAQNGFVDNDLFISEELFQEFTKDKGAPKEGDIIISAVGTLGQCYLVKKDDRFYFKDASVLWFENISNVNPRYIEYAFKSDLVIRQVLHKSMGATVGTLTISRARKIQIPIPPISEQKQIVAILDKTFAAIDQAQANIEKNIENAKELFDSKKEDYFNQLSLNNDLIPLNDVCEKIFAGGDKPKENFSKAPTEELNIPIIANALKDNGLYGYTNKAKVTKPSITVAARGSGTGHTEYRDYPFVPIVRLIVLTPNTDKVEVEFLMYSIKNLTITRSGSAIPQLTVPMIKSYSIPVPSKKKQTEIIDNLNQLEIELEDYMTTLEKKLDALENLKKSILQKAFSGELTVLNHDLKDLRIT